MRQLLSAAVLFATALAANAGPISFSNGWAEQRLQLFSSNDYSFGRELGIVSEGAVSLAWTRISRDQWDTRMAMWNWRVDQSVPATDLTRRGGDDRNISIYFVFLPEAEAAALEGSGIRRLMGNENVRILQYAWGGNHARGAVLGSPYAPGQGATVALRQAGTGSHMESVDLARDYDAAFGESPGALVGLAVSSDTDDTDSVVRAAIGNMRLN